MIRYILRRLLASIVVMFALSALIFFAGRGLVSGSAASMLAGANASQETIDQIEHELMNRLVLVYKTMEVKGKLKYRSLGHVSDLGPAGASGFSDDDLADDLEDHVDSIGKKR